MFAADVPLPFIEGVALSVRFTQGEETQTQVLEDSLNLTSQYEMQVSAHFEPTEEQTAELDGTVVVTVTPLYIDDDTDYPRLRSWPMAGVVRVYDGDTCKRIYPISDLAENPFSLGESAYLPESEEGASTQGIVGETYFHVPVKADGFTQSARIEVELEDNFGYLHTVQAPV